jgi:hypothetical protein
MNAQTGCYTSLSVLCTRGRGVRGISTCVALFSTSAGMTFSDLSPDAVLRW